MWQKQLLAGLGLTGVVSVLIAQPAWADVVQVTGVRLNPTASGLEVILQIADRAAPQVFTTSSDQVLMADIVNAQLHLPQGNAFHAHNPIEGIATISVINLNANTVRVTTTGQAGVPKAEVFQRDKVGLIFSLTPDPKTSQVPPTLAPDPPETSEQQPSDELELDEEPEAPGASSPNEAKPEEIEVVVTATRTEEEVTNVPRSVTVITREQLEQQQNLTNNLIDILGQLVPGYGSPNQFDRDASQSLRGRAPLVLIDGVPQTSNVFGSIGLRGIDPETVERIEVVRGPTGIYGAGAAGGVINIITRRPSEQRLTSRTEIGTSAALGNLEGDSFSYDLSHSISGTESNVDYIISVGAQFTNEFYDAEGDRIPNVNSTLDNSTVFNVLGKVGINFDDQQRLQLTVNHSTDSREPDYISDPIVNELPGRQKARELFVGEQEYIGIDQPGIDNTSINLDYNHDNFLGSSVRAQAYYWNSTVRSVPFDFRGGFFDVLSTSPIDAEALGGRLQIETPVFQTARLLWGADYRNEEDSRRFVIIDPVAYDASGGRIVSRLDERTNVPPYELENLGIFAQLQWDVSDRWLLSGGVRQEWIGFNVDDYTTFFGDNVTGGEQNFDATVFNAGVVYRATDNVSLFANFAQGFSAPDFSALSNLSSEFSSINNAFENLEPRKIDNYEIGVRGEWDNVQASLSGFFNYSALGAFLTNIQAGGAVELARAPQRNYGFEAALDWQPGETWQLGSSISWVEGEADVENTGDYTALSSFEIQPLKLTAYVEHQTTPGWRNRLQLLYVGDRDRAFEDETDVFPIEGYVSLDYISSIRLGAGTLNFGIENLLDNQYFPVNSQVLADDSFYIPARGRRLSVSYSIEW